MQAQAWQSIRGSRPLIPVLMAGLAVSLTVIWQEGCGNMPGEEQKMAALC